MTSKDPLKQGFWGTCWRVFSLDPAELARYCRWFGWCTGSREDALCRCDGEWSLSSAGRRWWFFMPREKARGKGMYRVGGTVPLSFRWIQHTFSYWWSIYL